MKAEIKQRWIDALRSGDYKQGEGELYNSGKDSYCCLGVLCVVNGLSADDIDGEEFPTEGQAAEFGLPDTFGTLPDSTTFDWETLADANDVKVPFTEIADIIEKQF